MKICRHGLLTKSLSAFLLALFSTVTIFRLGGKMVPDFYSYANGGSAWSSFDSATIGSLFGERGIQVESVMGAAAVGFLIESPILALLVAVSPIGAGITNAGADALGAALLFITFRRQGFTRSNCVLVSSAAHLLCGISGLFAMATRRIVNPAWSITLAGIAAIVAQYILSLQLHKEFSGIQWRYLLPGTLFLAEKVRSQLSR